MLIHTQQLGACIYISNDVRLGVFDLVVQRVSVDAEGLVHYALRGAETHIRFHQTTAVNEAKKTKKNNLNHDISYFHKVNNNKPYVNTAGEM